MTLISIDGRRVNEIGRKLGDPILMHLFIRLIPITLLPLVLLHVVFTVSMTHHQKCIVHFANQFIIQKGICREPF